MPLPANDAAQGGPASRLVDLNDLPVISRKVSPIDRGLMTPEQAGEYHKGNLQISQPEGVPAAFVPAAGDVLPQAQPPALAPQPAAPAAQTTTPAVPLTQGPEIRPNDPPRYQERLNQLFGQKRSAEEKAERIERQLQEVLARLDSRAPQSPAPYTNQYGSFSGAQLNAQPPSVPSEAPPQFNPAAGPFISRAEVAAMLEEQRQVNDLRNSHLLSRLEAEKQYPDVFGNPQLKSLADDIWDRDVRLQYDPRGPEKAALLARAIAFNPNAIPPNGAPAAPPQVRKEQLSALGASVPAGNESATSNDTRYRQALEVARRTNSDDDYALAMLIREGKA